MPPQSIGMAVCETCGGKGFVLVEEKKCPSCKGTGKAKSINLSELSEQQLNLALGGSCPACNGTGVTRVTEKCRECNGYGEIKECKVCGSHFGGDGDRCQ
ncbi:MAG TPA: hypothetical protein EYP67_07380 [Methanosarcinales archaeon]|nr:hypothetical protein [Methanosarcinales archaeon]